MEFGVAAKRIKSREKLGTRVSEARDQIIRSGLSGVIALDLSAIRFRRKAPLLVGGYEEIQSEMFWILKTEFEDKLPEIERKCQATSVFGVIAFATVAALHPNIGTTIIGAELSGRRLRPEDDRLGAFHRQLIERMRARSTVSAV
jgi:hypothetical protein